jgi:hypothetical protein
MPHRTHKWIWSGRVAAVLTLAGLAGYMYVVGGDQAGKLAAPVGLVIALATLLAPYLLPAYQPPASPPATAGPAPGPSGIVIIADHNSVAAQNIGEVTVNTLHPDRGK